MCDFLQKIHRMNLNSISNHVKKNTNFKTLAPPFFLISILLFLICFRIWNIGVMHTDDAAWVLSAVTPGMNPASDWAHAQGRIWAYVSGSFIFYALGWQGHIWGEILRIGSFVAFFISFFWYISKLTDKRIALLSASLFLSFFMMKWDGSILTTYPLITWVAGVAFIFALWSSRRYVLKENLLYLICAALLFLFSLFNNEGITVLFIVLFFSHSLIQGRYIDPSPVLVKSIKLRKRSFHIFSLFFAVSASYSLIFIAWYVSHPTTYDGHVLSTFDVGRFTKTLFHFSTSGSAIHDLLSPYVVNFGDFYAGTGKASVYYLSRNLQRSLHSPTSLLVCLITIWLLTTLTSKKGELASASTFENNDRILTLRGLMIAGLLIAIIPIIPVALTSKYQIWMADNHIRAYSHTIFSHFGWSCALAALLLSLLERLKNHTSIRKICIVIVIGFSGLLASQANTANDDMVNDIRPESGRWQIVSEMEQMNKAIFQSDHIWSPRLNNGSWYTVVSNDYWTEYAKRKFGSTTKISAQNPSLKEQLKPYLVHDYNYDGSGKNFVAVMSFAQAQTGQDKIAIYLEGGIRDKTASYLLQFNDRKGNKTQIQIKQLTPLESNREWLVVQIPDFVSSTIRIVRQDHKGREIELCALRAPKGVNLVRASEPDAVQFRLNAPENLLTGWLPENDGDVWSNKSSARLLLPSSVLPKDDFHLEFELSTLSERALLEAIQEVTVQIQGKTLALWSFSKSGRPTQMLVSIPTSLREKEADLSIALNISKLINPHAMGLSDDTRDLGVLLKSVRIVENKFNH